MEVPIDHPEFGRLQICTCRQGQINQQIRQRLFALSNLDNLRHLTFDNFKPRGHVGLSPHKADSLEMAYNQARQFAQSLNGWLLLQGGYGCGKTHLAAAIANFAVSMGVPTLFITVPDLLDALRFSWDSAETTFEERFMEIRQAPLLILDDFGTQNTTEWAREKLFQIINYRYINQLPLVVTTNLPLEDIEPRIRSRLLDPQLVTKVMILAPDYRNPTRDTDLEVLHELTFEKFDTRKGEGLSQEELRSLEKALQAAKKFAAHPEGWIVFMGPSGCGKTHLAAAIANYQIALGYEVFYTTASDLLDYLRASFSPDSSLSLGRRFQQMKDAPLLILDELGTQYVTPWALEKLRQLFNHRYNYKLPTVITTMSRLEDIDEYLRTRMLDRRLCTIYAIQVPSYVGTLLKETKTKAGRRR